MQTKRLGCAYKHLLGWCFFLNVAGFGVGVLLDAAAGISLQSKGGENQRIGSAEHYNARQNAYNSFPYAFAAILRDCH